MAGYDIEKHFDKIAHLYEKFEKYNPRKCILIKRQFKRIIGYLHGLSVLDLGYEMASGNGFFSLLAKRMGLPSTNIILYATK